MESLSNEVLFYILSFCQPKDAVSFCSTNKANNSILNDEFWSFYSKQRHPKKSVGYTLKQWIVKQEGIFSVSAYTVTRYSEEEDAKEIIGNKSEICCTQRTIKSLRRELSMTFALPPCKLVFRENGKTLDDKDKFSFKTFVCRQKSYNAGELFHIFYDGEN
ncbi:F-box containing protein [Brazilian marseillevirus]|uniref:F-box containing protein n=1 Tax=Brazilian marseillevirus TaxID=1813599 RepID=UPI00078542A0|nr:F-box containing protein [Brazilian marseillevirus]AMQ10533.1 F-box containing protein [Brazilian marseillevirus]